MATLIALCGLGLGSATASAGQLICKYNSLKKYDEKNVLAILKREVGALEINGKESFFCRNPRSARAGFTTKRIQAADGAFDHVIASCSRGWVRWTCEISKVRTIDFRFDSESKPGAVTIPRDMSPQFADSLFRRADTIAREQVSAERSCSRKTHDADEYALRLRDTYISRENVDGSEIDNEMEKRWDGTKFVETGRRIVTVTRSLMYLKFVREVNTDGTEDLRFECWDVLIVVG